MISTSSNHNFICKNHPEKSFIVKLEGKQQARFTIQELIDRARSLLFKQHEAILLLEPEQKIDLNRTVFNSIMKFKPIYFQFYKQIAKCQNDFDFIQPININFNVFKGQVKIGACLNDSISMLVKKVFIKAGIVFTEQFRIISDGRYLNDSNNFQLSTLKESNIHQNSNISIFEQTEGAGSLVTFVDLEDGSLKKVRPFCNTAPAYRKCGQGLNIEGICLNNKCPYFNKLVIQPIGYVHITLINNYYEDVKCPHPECQQFIKPETCGFVNCYFGWYGTKKVNDKSIDIVGTIEFAPPNVYTRFDSEGGTKMIIWRQLFVEASKNIHECCIICQKDTENVSETLINCENIENHQCHQSCKDRLCQSELRSCFLCISVT